MNIKFLHFFSLLLVCLPLHAQDPLETEDAGRQVTPEDRYFMRPAWSPDSQYLAFTSRNHQGIWVLDLQSEEISLAVDKPGAGYKFAWSPDGRFIAYRARVVENRRSSHTIELFDTQSGKAQRIQSAKFLGTPIWGSENEALFFVSGNRLIQSSLTADQEPRLEKTGLPGKRLAYTLNQELHISRAGDSLKNEGPVLEKAILNPTLSPSGDQVAYEEVGGDVIVQNLTTLKKASLGSGHRPAWSPDGEWVCFMVASDDGHEYLSSDIYIASADGKQRFALTKTKEALEMNPAWSPDGSAIAYDEHRSGAIMIISIQVR